MQTHSSVHTPISGCDYTGIAYSGTDSERRNDSWLVVTSPIIDSGAVLISDQSHEPMCFVLAFIFAFFGRLNNGSLEKLGARHDRLCTTTVQSWGGPNQRWGLKFRFVLVARYHAAHIPQRDHVWHMLCARSVHHPFFTVLTNLSHWVPRLLNHCLINSSSLQAGIMIGAPPSRTEP